MTHKLLLADDSVTIQRVIELTFAGEDVQVVTAGDGEQAIAKVQAEHPDIVLADIAMPKRSGYDVSAYIKGEPGLAHIPVLLLAGAFEPVDEARAQAAGCDGVLVKPFDPQHVIARVRELLHGAKGSSRQAVADVARPAERLAPHRPVELPERHDSDEAASDMDTAGLADAFGPRGAVTASVAASHDAEVTRAVPDDSLDDYFDRLDAAFANAGTGAAEPAPERVHEPEVMPRHESVLVEKDVDWFDASPAVEGTAAVREPSPPAQLAAADGDSEWLDVFPPLIDPPHPVSVERPGSHTIPQPPPLEPPETPPDRNPQPTPVLVARSAPPPVQASAPPAAHRPPAPSEAGPLLADAFDALLAAEQGDPGASPVRFTVPSGPPVVTDELIEDITKRVVQQLGPGAVRDVVADIVSKVAERLVREEIDRIRKTLS